MIFLPTPYLAIHTSHLIFPGYRLGEERRGPREFWFDTDALLTVCRSGGMVIHQHPQLNRGEMEIAN